MSREIKFRAWDKEKKHFVYFELFNGVNNHTPPIYSSAKLEDWEGYTGLKDKNGKEIYKDDILYWSEVGIILIVEWSEESGAWILNYKNSGGMLTETYALNFKIIGNKWENPELIK